MIRCPECGVLVLAHADRCSNCGAELSRNEIEDAFEKNFDDSATRKVIDFKLAKDIDTQVECEGEEGL